MQGGRADSEMKMSEQKGDSWNHHCKPGSSRANNLSVARLVFADRLSCGVLLLAIVGSAILAIVGGASVKRRQSGQ